MTAWRSTADIEDIHSVLIISQDDEMASVWETLFKRKNCHVFHENKPRESLQTARLLSPALIVLHLDMPRRELLELCRELRVTTEGTLLLLADRESEAEALEYYRAGVDERLATPISPMALLIKSMAWIARQDWAPQPFRSQAAIA